MFSSEKTIATTIYFGKINTSTEKHMLVSNTVDPKYFYLHKKLFREIKKFVIVFIFLPKY